MVFPDYLDQPSRTIITGEGGTVPSRFKHVVKTPSGRYRRLLPIELERMNMFPDNHTLHAEVSDGRRAFLMGNALVCGVVEQIGRSLYQFIYDEVPTSSRPIFTKRDAKPMLDLGLFEDEKQEFVVNRPKKQYTLDKAKHLLIGLVKKDNEAYFLTEELAIRLTKHEPTAIILFQELGVEGQRKQLLAEGLIGEPQDLPVRYGLIEHGQ